MTSLISARALSDITSSSVMRISLPIDKVKQTLFKPSDHSIKASMMRYLPDGMTNDQKTAYSEAISALKVTLIYLVGFQISVLSENKLISLLEKVNIGDRNEVMKKLRSFCGCTKHLISFLSLRLCLSINTFSASIMSSFE
jgi:hypothetical protein